MSDPASGVTMKIDLTIDDIDEEVLAKARRYASTLGKTVEQLVEEFLTGFANDSELDASANESKTP
jgi:antitoxin component of RelBE/YafQ-DinJ toxin-antitoxin module